MVAASVVWNNGTRNILIGSNKYSIPLKYGKIFNMELSIFRICEIENSHDNIRIAPALKQ